MDQNDLFTSALGLGSPWMVVESGLKERPDGTKALELELDFKRGARFACAKCGESCPVHDTKYLSWRHLQFWQHETILRARVPRTACEKDGVLQVPVPWARKGSGFTLFFEAFAMMLAKEMPIAAAARILNEYDTRLWRMVRHYVGKAHARQDWSEVSAVGIDETSTRKGKRYATVVVDIDPSGEKPARLLHMSPEAKGRNIGKFTDEMAKHGACPEQVRIAAIDMSTAYRKGVAEHLPMAEVAFDRFHVMKKAGEAVDQVRKQLQKQGWEMPGALWALRGNAENLSDKKRERREQICRQYKEIGRSLGLREMLRETWDYYYRRDAEAHLKSWYGWAVRSRLEPFLKLAQTIKTHWQGIMGYYPNRVTSAAIEAINGVIQTARRRARGYRNFENLRAIAYWMAGDLNLKLPSAVTHIK